MPTDSNNQSSKDEHLSEDQHRLLRYEKLLHFGNDAFIRFRAIWKCARFCAMNKLKIPLGKPQETFLALEETLRYFTWPIDNNTKKVEASSSEQTSCSSTSTSTINHPIILSSSGEINVSTDKGDWWCDLHCCGLLLQLIQVLEMCQTKALEFEFVKVSFVQSLIKLPNSMVIHGMYVWLKNIHQLDWSWIQACEHKAAGNLEQAAYEYKLLLNKH
ncbi:unnamed protein product [Rotaria socialis]|uniref:Uncharacterized protein n=1 Tax=Rotaria socialis TaxID=392032 RepID=A0A821UTA0_9BILA|nr:unnamed protein product [Rotaria socialis]